MKSLTTFLNENTHPHSVHVRDYSNGSDVGPEFSKDWKSAKFKDAVKTHGAKHIGSTDKGELFGLKDKHQASSFISTVNKNHKELDADHSDY